MKIAKYLFHASGLSRGLSLCRSGDALAQGRSLCRSSAPGTGKSQPAGLVLLFNTRGLPGADRVSPFLSRAVQLDLRLDSPKSRALSLLPLGARAPLSVTWSGVQRNLVPGSSQICCRPDSPGGFQKGPSAGSWTPAPETMFSLEPVGPSHQLRAGRGRGGICRRAMVTLSLLALTAALY